MDQRARARKKRFLTCQSQAKGDTDENSRCKTIEKRACSCLFDLSDKTYQETSNPERSKKQLSQNGTYCSPWVEQVTNETITFTDNDLGNRKSTLEDLREFNNVNFLRRKTSNYKKGLRDNPEARQKLPSMPRLMKTETLAPLSALKALQGLEEIEDRTYASHQVLHFTRALKDCTNRSQKKQNSVKSNILASCPQVECKLNINKSSHKDSKRDRIKENRLNDLTWSNKVRAFKLRKKKQERKMLEGSCAFRSQQLPKMAPSNLISRLLHQKYLLACDEVVPSANLR